METLTETTTEIVEAVIEVAEPIVFTPEQIRIQDKLVVKKALRTGNAKLIAEAYKTYAQKHLVNVAHPFVNTQVKNGENLLLVFDGNVC